jgi:SAM-dependent methyltransferase
MSSTDWEGRYQSGDMPWEKGEPSPGLVDFLAAHPELPRGTVAVPGCGTGHDARVWAKAGFDVSGFDLAPSAIRLCCEKTAQAGLTAAFAQSDFLADAPPTQFDWLKAVLRWLKPGGQLLAIHYMIRDEQGPPFGVTQEELMERFLPHFELKQGWVPRSYANRTGLELKLWWQRR